MFHVKHVQGLLFELQFDWIQIQYEKHKFRDDLVAMQRAFLDGIWMIKYFQTYCQLSKLMTRDKDLTRKPDGYTSTLYSW